MIRGHGGNIYDLATEIGCLPEDIIDMSSNTNPLGILPVLMEYLHARLEEIKVHPEPDARGLSNYFARHYRLSPDQVLTGNGTTQFIFDSPRALNPRQVLILGPTYSDYADSCEVNGIKYSFLIAKEENLFQPDIEDVKDRLSGNDLVFICNSNNPTGSLIPKNALLELCSSCPETIFIIDESYLPFSRDYDQTTMIHSGLPNLVVLHSFSKVFHIPGLRLGFLIASPEYVEKFRQVYEPWCVNSLAQVAGRFLLEKASVQEEFLGQTREFVAEETSNFKKRLGRILCLDVFPSHAPFMLIKIKEGLDSAGLCSRMAQNRILIRDCVNFRGLSSRFVRISLRTPEINAMAAEKLCGIFA